MLLNLSNHPFENWSDSQKQAAIDRFGSVQDLAFPNIDPEFTKDEITDLVREYIIKAQSFHPNCIHIMGELTFTFSFVSFCRYIGVKCFASTTHRIVEEIDGKKVTTFDFKQFRPYF
ncbi:MAG: hypothetical protein RLZZ546_261 [Bacteroidota bacterium]|jgi:hypothetical protein